MWVLVIMEVALAFALLKGFWSIWMRRTRALQLLNLTPQDLRSTTSNTSSSRKGGNKQSKKAAEQDYVTLLLPMVEEKLVLDYVGGGTRLIFTWSNAIPYHPLAFYMDLQHLHDYYATLQELVGKQDQDEASR